MWRARLIRFWKDESGGLTAAGGYLLVVVILVAGLIPGLIAIRDHLVQEYGDLSRIAGMPRPIVQLPDF